MPFFTAILTALTFIWHFFRDWLLIFAAPVQNSELLWIIIPIWISWFFGEFFQEKKGTSFGNAITNGAVPLIIGVDWARYLTRSIVEQDIPISFLIILKYALCFLVAGYGLAIIILGIQGRKSIQFIGRVRTMTYVLVV